MESHAVPSAQVIGGTVWLTNLERDELAAVINKLQGVCEKIAVPRFCPRLTCKARTARIIGAPSIRKSNAALAWL